MAFFHLPILLLVSALSFADPGEGPSPWPHRVWNDISKEVDSSGSLLANVIFDQLDDFDWGHKYKGITPKIGVARTVRDNQDILNTWSVNDALYIDVSRNATEYSFPLVPSLATPVNLNLGIGGRLTVNHIRQVPSTKYHEIATIESVGEEVKSDQKILEAPEAHWYDVDLSIRPRFSRLWNPLLNFYRIPWSKKGLRKLGKSEIVSYSVSGFVSVGLEAGFLPIEVPKTVDLSVGVGTQVFVRGEYRITLLKEDDRYVRVKLTRLGSVGTGITVGSETSKIEITDAFLIVPSLGFTVVPFKLNWEYENKKDYNLGFRYDLDDEMAEEAFEKAMRGNFKFSSEMAKKNKAVTYLMTRRSLEKKKAASFKFGVDWLLNWKKKRQLKNQWITIERPDGKTEIFKSSVELSKSWSTFWGMGEKKNFIFSAIFDQSAFDRLEDDSFQLVSEVLYEDVKTTGKEMRSYMNDVERVIGNQDVLPDLPLMVPSDDGTKMKKAKYDRSSFYFGQFYSRKQVTKFLMTPEKKAWEIAVRSFKHLDRVSIRKVRAKHFFKQWMKLQRQFSAPMNKAEMVKALKGVQKLFDTQKNGISALATILATLDKEEVGFFLTATNNSFGRIQFRGRTTMNAEKLLLSGDETIEFESTLGSVRPNPETMVKDLKIVHDKEIKITLNLPKRPEYLFFKVLRTTGWKRIKTIKEFVYLNRGRFKEGVNKWTLSASSSDILDKEILSAFKDTAYYTFRASSSPDRKNWGSMVSSRFKYTAPAVDDQAKSP